VPLKTARLTISRESLPQQYRELGIRFERQSVAKIKAGSPPSDMVLLRPAAGLLSDDDAVGHEPRWNHILCGLSLKAGDGTAAQGSGQLLITGRRFIGMIDDGTATGAPPLSIRKSGSVFCFTFLRDDVSAPVIKKNMLKPSDFSFRSKAELGAGFQLTVFAAFAYVANGKTNYWHDKNMLYTLSEEGRQGQLQD
jgi:hypothetical protein